MDDFKKYFCESNFYIHDFAKEYKNDIIEQYKQKYTPKRRARSVRYENKEFENKVSSMFLNVIERYFSVGPRSNIDIFSWIYIQNNQEYCSYYHHHLKTSSINAVFYIDPPKSGGELSLLYLNEKINIKPEINKLYLFPCWMGHAPMSQIDQEYRVTVNLEYLSKERPYYKKSGVFW